VVHSPSLPVFRTCGQLDPDRLDQILTIWAWYFQFFVHRMLQKSPVTLDFGILIAWIT